MKPTIKDIAARAGVSIASVSVFLPIKPVHLTLKQANVSGKLPKKWATNETKQLRP